MRDDLPEIIGLASKHLKPKVIHIPTNAIASEKIKDLTVRSLEVLKQTVQRSLLRSNLLLTGLQGFMTR